MKRNINTMGWLTSIPSLFFPRNCAACGNSLYPGEQTICLYCISHLPLTGFWEHPKNKAAEVFYGRVNFSFCASYLLYKKGNSAQKLIHALKYKSMPEVGKYLGGRFGTVLKNIDLLDDVTALVPVPLHPKKERQRGYNQSLMIANGISAKMDVPVLSDLIIRRTHGASQTRKDRYNRWENAKDRFVLKKNSEIKAAHFLLVDDVITTGSTLEAMANILKVFPEIKISAVSIGFSC